MNEINEIESPQEKNNDNQLLIYTHLIVVLVFQCCYVVCAQITQMFCLVCVAALDPLNLLCTILFNAMNLIVEKTKT